MSWLKHSEGISVADKVLLLFVKFYYISLRITSRAFGKRRRDKLILKGELDFGKLLYKSFGFWKRGKKSHDLLKFKMSKYNCGFYCRKNTDDFKIMTYHDDDIIEYHFCPKEGDIVVDVGAHIGRYTLIAANRVGLNGKVVAIEANPNNFKMLNNNVKLNQLTNVTSLNYAVYSQETKIKLYLAGEGLGQTMYNTIMTGRAKEGKEKYIEVDGNTLDHLLQLQGISKVNWIKIDVEGAELEVLRGTTEIISHSNDISLLIELHNLSGSNTTLYEPIVEFLNKYNFKIDFEMTHESGEKHLIAIKQEGIES